MLLNKAGRCWKGGSSSYYELFSNSKTVLPSCKDQIEYKHGKPKCKALKGVGVVLFIVQCLVKEEEMMM